MAAIELDESLWPLVVVRFEGPASEQEFGEYLRRMSQIMNRKEVTATVIDATGAAPTPATQRRRQSEWIREHESLLRRYSAGTAFVISSPLTRGVLTAILWMQPLPQEHIVVATRAEAVQWARTQLLGRGARVAAR